MENVHTDHNVNFSLLIPCRVVKSISEHVSFQLAWKMKDLEDDEMPFLLTLCYTKWGFEVLSYIYGKYCISHANCSWHNWEFLLA